MVPPTEGIRSMTVFDPSTLHQLVDDAAERAFVLDLARTFRRMLDARVDRVIRGVAGDDPDEAMDAVLSLKVSATMTGARELSYLAAGVETELRRRDLVAARLGASLLPAAAMRVEAAIDAYLARSATPTTFTTF